MQWVQPSNWPVRDHVDTPYDNIFVLGTGRCGTTSFAKASHHITNYTSAHESLGHKGTADTRFAYPLGHIEADNRLSWFLPQLEERMAGRRVLYVHMLRDREAVARSYHRRWHNGRNLNLMHAFGHALVMREKDWPSEEQELEVARFFVDTVTANVNYFLRDKEHVTLWLETAEQDFPAFLEKIGAEGDLEGAVAEWGVKHNASRKRQDAAQ